MIQQIGKHRVMHSDIMYSDFGKLMRSETVRFIYSDPPWGTGNFKVLANLE